MSSPPDSKRRKLITGEADVEEYHKRKESSRNSPDDHRQSKRKHHRKEQRSKWEKGEDYSKYDVTDLVDSEENNPEKGQEIPEIDLTRFKKNIQNVTKNLHTQTTHSSMVAHHYNSLEQNTYRQRKVSRILYLRNFNNWIKSMLIQNAMRELREWFGETNTRFRVLDLCAGKGGDQQKWRKSSASHVAFVDIADVSMDQCRARYEETVERAKLQKQIDLMFTAEFIVADCCQTRLSDVLEEPKFHLASCQFSLHYAFESYNQATMMLRNACESLVPGGIFIGTIPDAYQIIHRLRASTNGVFGNDIYQVHFPEEVRNHFPLFGCKYDFHLDDQVNLPEFLVYFPLLEHLLDKLDMELIFVKNFQEYFNDQVARKDGRGLLSKMQALEPFPPLQDTPLNDSTPEAYSTAERLAKQMVDAGDINKHFPNRPVSLGTLSKSEWEMATLYMVFAFRKRIPSEVPSHATATDSENTVTEPHQEASSSAHAEEGETSD